MADLAVTPHPSFDHIYNIGEWSFSIEPDEDGTIEYVDRAIACWQAWREFLVRREAQAQIDPLF